MVIVAEVMTDAPVLPDRGHPAGLPDILAYTDETCRAVAEEMATTGVMSMPVVDRETGLICGNVNAEDLLAGRKRAVVRESEQIAHIRLRRDKNLDS
jgi:hypothetical protein